MANSNLNHKQDYFDERRPNLHEMPPRRSASPPKRHRIIRIAAWTAACAIAMVVLCIGAVVGFINSSSGHRYLLQRAQREAAQELGVRVDLENFTPHWTSLGLDLYGVRIAGAAPYSDPALFQADHVEVSVQVVSLLQKKWHLQTVEID